MKVCFLIVSLLISGCGSVAILPEPVNFKPVNFNKDQAKRVKLLKRFSSSLRIRYKGKGMSLSGKGNAVTEVPNYTRIELRDPFGRTQNIVVLNKKLLITYYPTKKRAYFDNEAGKRYLKNMAGVSLSFKTFQYLLIGALPRDLQKKKLKDLKWDGRAGVYRTTITGKHYVAELFIDPNRYTLRKVRLIKGDEAIVVTYEDTWECCEGNLKTKVFMPGEVALESVDDDLAVQVSWNKIKVLREPIDKRVFKIQLPKYVRKFLIK